MYNDQVWGPVAEGRGRRWWRRILVVVGTLVAVTVVVAVGGAWWMSAQLPKTTVDGLAERGRPMHVLVVGSDSREELTPEERRELATGFFEGERADTIMVLTVDRGRVATLAFPRDLWVEQCDGSSARINAAIEIGGPSCMVETVRRLSGIRAHHYLEVTFGGFRDLVDAVGGVELCLEEAIADRDAGIDLPAGCQRLDGADALGFVRVRKIDDDFGRIERQQAFLRALAREVTTPSTLANPIRTFGMARDAGAAVAVDETMGPLSLGRLGWGMRSLARGEAVTHVVPGTPRVTAEGAHVLDMVVTEAEPIFSRFRTGAVLDDIGSAPDDVASPPGEIEVTVLNAAGVAGLATRTGERLEAEGFVVAALGNAEQRPDSVVRHAPGRASDALLVARTLGLPERFEEVAGLDGITVVLGEEQGTTP